MKQHKQKQHKQKQHKQKLIYHHAKGRNQFLAINSKTIDFRPYVAS
jgi:hypothetical protein